MVSVVKPVFLLVVLALLSSCNIASIKPKAIGRAGQGLIVIEQELWDGLVGEAFRDEFEKPYPVLPQPEPYFDLRQVTGGDLKDLQKEWRTIVVIGNISSTDPTTKLVRQSLGEESFTKAQSDPKMNLAFRENLWADNQIIVYLFGTSDAQLVESIRSRAPMIEQRLLESDLELVKRNTYQGGRNTRDMQKVQMNLGIDLSIPVDYKIAISDSINQSVWLRRESRNSSSNILVKVANYSEEFNVTEAKLVSIRNLMGEKYITSSAEGAYMTTDSVNLPIIFKETNLNGYYALEARGIWAMENDFMGGSFLSYLVYDEATSKVVFLDGFLYAPEQEKRELMQRFEVIFSSLKIEH